MKNHITVKQLALGFVLGITLVTAIGAMVSGTPAVGRFQMGTTQNKAFIIDTTTGQVWPQDEVGFADPKLKVKIYN